MKTQPLYYYPTTVLLIDDNKEFSNSIVDVFKTQPYFYLEAPDCAADAKVLIDNPKTGATDGLPESVQESAEYQHIMIDISIRDIQNLYYKNKKKKTISSVIVDYQMPEIDGLSFLKSIENKNITKILLTGVANQDQAIDAFNNKIIDFFIPKSTSDLISKLNYYILESQKRHFIENTRFAANGINLNSPDLTAVGEENFILLVQELCYNNKIVEYYLIEDTGSFVMFDSNKKKYTLFITTLGHLNSICDLIDDSTYESHQMIKDMRSGASILCYYNDQNIEIPSVRSWHKYIRPAKQLKGNKANYYYYFG